MSTKGFKGFLLGMSILAKGLAQIGQFDAAISSAKSAALGADIAFAVTSNNQTASNMYNLFQDKLKDARFVDSTEGQNIDQDLGMSDQIDAGTFINSRF